ncbi:hypothetical protein [Candidatus Solincola sp.]|jgi:hypothetical protein|nr:hypothetical protein [Actinomycetota bacterium]MDI7253121.1 hypothetical protein [Actinomycetota bacterium]
MKKLKEGRRVNGRKSHGRVVLGYARGMLVEVLAVAALSSTALLLMFLVKALHP